ncbi:MAG TPA: methyltransferase, partial [Rheinheimera sp.]|nr:methyltransferase [Rheinheimera sp.]
AQQFVCADVLAAPLQHILQPQQQLVALHACGQLHITMLQQAVQAGCQQLQLVPCCYHLIPQPHYQPLSDQGVARDLQLNKDDLKLVVQGQVTAGERIEKLRATEVLWRLAYDELRIELSGQSHYRPLASVAKHWFSGDLAAFAGWAAAQHQLSLPPKVDWPHYLQRAVRRLALVQRIELVRHLFRRPLELWLALDKALYLQQHGYQVNLSELCDYQITPRNMLLSAIKPA